MNSSCCRLKNYGDVLAPLARIKVISNRPRHQTSIRPWTPLGVEDQVPQTSCLLILPPNLCALISATGISSSRRLLSKNRFAEISASGIPMEKPCHVTIAISDEFFAVRFYSYTVRRTHYTVRSAFLMTAIILF